MAVFKNQRGGWTSKFYFTDWTGQKKQKKKEGFKTKREARQFEIDFLNKTQNNVQITFSNLVKNYMEDCRARLKPTTFLTKENIIDGKILCYFKDTPINEIDSIKIRKWQNELIGCEKNYSKTYLKTINTQISAIFNFAVKYYHLGYNPVAKCGSIGKRQADSIQFWTADEFHRFIVQVDREMYRVIFSLLFFSGMRIGELLALTLQDFNLESSTVSINKSYACIKGRDIIQSPKTEKSKRIVTLPCNITKEIFAFAKSLYKYEESQRLFVISRQSVNNEMEKACAKSGVKKIRIHDIRHSHASLLIEIGFSPLVVCERLGHENIQTTLNTYSHLYPNKHEEVAEKLAALF